MFGLLYFVLLFVIRNVVVCFFLSLFFFFWCVVVLFGFLMCVEFSGWWMCGDCLLLGSGDGSGGRLCWEGFVVWLV